MKMNTGKMARSSMAEMSHHRAALPWVRPATSVGKVWALWKVRVIAKSSSFQEKMVVNALVAARPGSVDR
jgi:hypothetical protein